MSTLEKESQAYRLRQLEANLEGKYPDGIPFNYNGMFFLLEEAIDWIMKQLLSLPQGFLAYYHLWPPHDPYLPRIEFVNQFADSLMLPTKPEHVFSLNYSAEYIRENRQRYDEYIAFVDSEFGRLVNFMESEGILEDTVVIITSDHGELFERGITGHLNSTLYQNLLSVPLLISMLGHGERHDVYAPTSCVDLMPTILHITGKPIPGFIDGEILPGFKSPDTGGERSIYALEAKSSSKSDPFQLCTLSLINGRYKLIHYRGYQGELKDELYDLENDPEELENLNSTMRSVSKEIGAELAEKIGELQEN